MHSVNTLWILPFFKGTARVLSQFLLEGERNKIQKKLNKKGGLKLPTTPTTRAYGRKQLRVATGEGKIDN
jgi:hypothetical protein